MNFPVDAQSIVNRSMIAERASPGRKTSESLSTPATPRAPFTQKGVFTWLSEWFETTAMSWDVELDADLMSEGSEEDKRRRLNVTLHLPAKLINGFFHSQKAEKGYHRNHRNISPVRTFPPKVIKTAPSSLKSLPRTIFPAD